MKNTNINTLELNKVTGDFNNEEQDLFIIKNEKTTSFLNGKGVDTDILETFETAMGDTYYIIPNGYKEQWEYERTPFKSINFVRLADVDLPKELFNDDFNYLQKHLFKIFKTDSFAYTSTSSYAAFWYVQESEMNPIVHNEGKTLRAVTLVDGDIIAIFEDDDENDYIFKVIAF